MSKKKKNKKKSNKKYRDVTAPIAISDVSDNSPSEEGNIIVVGGIADFHEGESKKKKSWTEFRNQFKNGTS